MSAIVAALTADRSLLVLSPQLLAHDVCARFHVCRKIAYRAIRLAHAQVAA